MPNNKYPWEKWLDGNKHLLQRGTDFIVSARSFSAAFYLACRERGLSGTCKTYDRDTVCIQARNADGPADFSGSRLLKGSA